MSPLRLSAVITLALWAAWWLFFAVASSVSEHGGHWKDAFGIYTLVLLLLIGVPTVAWRRPGLGAWLLLAESLFLFWFVLFFAHNPLNTTLFLVLTLALPPLAAGVLLLLPGSGPGASRQSGAHAGGGSGSQGKTPKVGVAVGGTATHFVGTRKWVRQRWLPRPRSVPRHRAV